jgi:hypothetical protein
MNLDFCLTRFLLSISCDFVTVGLISSHIGVFLAETCIPCTMIDYWMEGMDSVQERNFKVEAVCTKIK